MKKTLLVVFVIVLLTACKSANGNSVSKLETTIYKTFNHDELVIEDGFNSIKKTFTEKDTFYHADLLTIEYGANDTKEKEESIKDEIDAYDVLYLNFSFKTGDVSYIAMESNHVYNYETYLFKMNEDDIWHIYKMEQIIS